MDFNNNNSYLVKITDECYEEMKQIYDYIANNLKADNSAFKLLKSVRMKILKLVEMPKIYSKINKRNRAKMEYRRLVVKNYVILYTVDDNKKIVYISHMYFKGKKYL